MIFHFLNYPEQPHAHSSASESDGNLNVAYFAADKEPYSAKARSLGCSSNAFASFLCHGEDDGFLLDSKCTRLVFKRSIWYFF